jgi:hypothetical protein
MISAYGAQGYGWYWMIVEMLREQKDYKYPIKTKYAYNAIAQELRVDVDATVTFIEDCINEFSLLSSDGDYLWSNSLADRMKPLDDRRRQARDAANARWNKKGAVRKDRSGVEDEPNIEPQDDKPIDPAKVKSKDVLKKDKCFAFLSDEIEKSMGLPKDVIERERQKCLDWLSAKGRSFKDYRAFFRNWMRTAKDSMPSTNNNGMIY